MKSDPFFMEIEKDTSPGPKKNKVQMHGGLLVKIPYGVGRGSP